VEKADLNAKTGMHMADAVISNIANRAIACRKAVPVMENEKWTNLLEWFGKGGMK